MANRNGNLLRKYGVPVLIAVVVLILLLWLLWLFVQPKGFEQKVAFIQLASTVVGGATLVGGLLLNFWGQWINQNAQFKNQEISLRQLANAKDQLDLTRKGQITERFTKAVEHLGDEKAEVRLGGIAALKQIVDQGEASHQVSTDQVEASDRRWQIMEILTSYVRGRAQFKNNRKVKPTLKQQTCTEPTSREHFSLEPSSRVRSSEEQISSGQTFRVLSLRLSFQAMGRNHPNGGPSYRAVCRNGSKPKLTTG